MANIHQAEGWMRAHDVERDHTEERIISIGPIRRDVEEGLDMIDLCVARSRSFGAKKVYIFGSLADAERDHHPRDIDLGVSGLPNEVFFRTYGELLGVMDHRFDLVDLDFDSPFVRKLREHGNLERLG
jgi:predicted nucleotidyltransferase